jgi:DNA-binding NarL/FixJ family response regulator
MGHYQQLHQAPATAFHFSGELGDSPRPMADIDMLAVPAFCLDEEAGIIGLNAAAERLLAQADGLRCSGTVLATTEEALTDELQRLVRDAASGGSGALRIARPSARPAYAAIAVPCRHQADTAWLFLADATPDHAEQPRLLARLISLYRLTPAEAAIAQRIAAGSGLPGIAKALDLAPSTIRTHTKHIFTKMQVHSQVLLARLVFYAGLFDG